MWNGVTFGWEAVYTPDKSPAQRRAVTHKHPKAHARHQSTYPLNQVRGHQPSPMRPVDLSFQVDSCSHMGNSRCVLVCTCILAYLRNAISTRETQELPSTRPSAQMFGIGTGSYPTMHFTPTGDSSSSSGGKYVLQIRDLRTWLEMARKSRYLVEEQTLLDCGPFRTWVKNMSLDCWMKLE